MNCIIINSNKTDCALLAEYIAKTQRLNLTGIFTDVVTAAKALYSHNPGLVFMDIEEQGAVAFIERLNAGQKLIVISSSPADALQAFDLGATDYLLKPVSYDRFVKAISKIKSDHATNDVKPVHENDDPEYFFVKADNKFEKIHRKEILYIEGLQNYITIQTATKKVITYSSLKSIENYLSEKEFLRVQKSFIVSISKIDSIDSDDVIIGKTSIPISRAIKENVLKTILSNRLYKYQC